VEGVVSRFKAEGSGSTGSPIREPFREISIFAIYLKKTLSLQKPPPTWKSPLPHPTKIEGINHHSSNHP